MKWENQKSNNFERESQDFKFGCVKFEMSMRHPSGTIVCTINWICESGVKTE